MLLATLLFALLLSGCFAPQERIEQHSGLTMGTSFTVKWVTADTSQSAAIRKQINDALINVNQSMSTYIQDSELSRLNRLPVGSTVTLSEDLNSVLSQALEISQQSDGAFDVTVGPLVNLWGFGPDGRVVKAPSDSEIEKLKQRVGYQYAELNAERRELTRQRDIYIDLSAIAKGFGVDRLADILEQSGITSYLVEIGGELRARGQKPDGQSWKIAIEAPKAGTREAQRIIAVRNFGIASSGDYRNYFEEDGVRFSHTIDPATGKPIRHRLASVTVLAEDCATADALATTMMVMGTERAMAFAVEQQVEAFLITKTDNGFSEQMTPGFKQYLVE